MEVKVSDEETRLRRQQKIKKRNLIAKEMRENKSMGEKVINPKKTEYKRVKLSPRSILEDEDDT